LATVYLLDCKQVNLADYPVGMDADDAARLRAVINKLSRRFNVAATDEQLTPAQASALALVAWRGPLSLAELTAIEGLNPTMVSRVVGRLVDGGLARRVQNPEDLRAGVVEITDLGGVVNERIKQARGAVVSEYLERVPAEDRATILGALPALETLANELYPPAEA
jgi:DNA-binding MarR family transcriptional regulator